jgi:hypothetical protein
MVVLLIVGAAVLALGWTSGSSQLIVIGGALCGFAGFSLLARSVVSQSRRR